jgi:midasin (ATPase involved in ribosome maturation)
MKNFDEKKTSSLDESLHNFLFFQQSYYHKVGCATREMLLRDIHIEKLLLSDTIISVFLMASMPPLSQNLSFKRHVNFYCDADETISSTIGNLMNECQKKLSILQEQFQDNDLLADCSNLCIRILNFHDRSPIVKLAVGLEILMDKLNQWEECASRFYSVRSLLDNLMQEYIRLRDRETSQIGHLVRIYNEMYAKQVFNDDTSTIWDLVQKLTCDDNGRTVIHILYEYLSNAPYGEFIWRISLLEAIGWILPQNPSTQRAKTILSYLVAHFKCLLPNIDHGFVQNISEIKKELEDMIQLRRWNSARDYRILIDTIRRQNRQLSKATKKLREKFSQPITTFLCDLSRIQPDQDRIDTEWARIKSVLSSSELQDPMEEDLGHHLHHGTMMVITPSHFKARVAHSTTHWREINELYSDVYTLYTEISKGTTFDSTDRKNLKNMRYRWFTNILRATNHIGLAKTGSGMILSRSLLVWWGYGL